MSNSIAPGSSADVNVRVTALTTNPNVSAQYKTIILKKNLVNGVNTLTQEMMSATNTKYVVKYDYVLGEDVTVPVNCILEFDGGSISASGNNDTITGQNTGIEAGLVKIFNIDVILAGSWNVTEAYPEWFGAKGDDLTDDTISIQKTIDSFVTVIFQNKIYLADTLLVNRENFSIKGKGTSTIKAINNNSNYIIKTYVTHRRRAEREVKELTFDCNNICYNGIKVSSVQTLFEDITVLTPKTNGILIDNSELSVGSIFEVTLHKIFIENKLNLTSEYNGTGIYLDTSDCTIDNYVSVHMPTSAFVGGENVVNNVHPYNGSPIFEKSIGIISNGYGNKFSNCYFDCVATSFIANRSTSLVNCSFCINKSLIDLLDEPPVFLKSAYSNVYIWATNCYFENAYDKGSKNPYIAYQSNKEFVILTNPIVAPNQYFSDNIEDYDVTHNINTEITNIKNKTNANRYYRLYGPNQLVPANSTVNVVYDVPDVKYDDYLTLITYGAPTVDGIIYNSYLGNNQITVMLQNITDSDITFNNGFLMIIIRDFNNETIPFVNINRR